LETDNLHPYQYGGGVGGTGGGLGVMLSSPGLAAQGEIESNV